ncbi:MAG: polysaccharide biosynthesis/export family protein [Prevotellaceae bacterium]|jgi:polysaccharide export outer membrane protein|nr:polysaccharide biosynthesis/export family protein [Prevotellaceae bacterium]
MARKIPIIIFPVFFSVVIFSSCITSQKINYLQKPGISIPAYKDTLSYQDYRLRTGDCLYIRVYTLNDDIGKVFNSGSSTNMQSMMSSSASDLFTYMVRPDGNINIPLFDDIYVRDKSVREVKELLEQKLKSLDMEPESTAPSSAVDVYVVKRFFSIIGAGLSGRYTLNKDKVNIFEALAMAGDISLYGDRSKVRIVREINEKTEIKIFDVRSADILHSEYYYIEPNDVIYIQSVNEQFFSMTHLSGVLSTTFSTLSFGMLIYNSFFKKN